MPRILMELPAETDTVAFPVHTVWFEFAMTEHVRAVAVHAGHGMIPTVAEWVVGLEVFIVQRETRQCRRYAHWATIGGTGARSARRSVDEVVETGAGGRIGRAVAAVRATRDGRHIEVLLLMCRGSVVGIPRIVEVQGTGASGNEADDI